MARIHWVAGERWDVFRSAEWEAHLLHAHALTFAKLTPRTRAVLALPAAERNRLIADRRKLLGARAAAKS